MKNSVLLKKNLYNKSFPEKLIYLKRTLPTPSQHREYVLIGKKGQVDGELVCGISSYPHWRKDYNGKTLTVDFIKANEYNKKNGTYLLNFAKNLSKQLGCNGYILLKADTSFTPNRIPHLFYRKNDFTSLEKKYDAKMDKFIKAKKDARHTDFPSLLMYYPKPKEEKENNFLGKFKKIFSALFK